MENATTLEEPDQCILFYAMSVLLYHMRQYQSALSIVEKLFRFIGQIGNERKIFFVENRRVFVGLDATLSWKICLLLTELYLCTFRVKDLLLSWIRRVRFMFLAGKCIGNNSSSG